MHVFYGKRHHESSNGQKICLRTSNLNVKEGIFCSNWKLYSNLMCSFSLNKTLKKPNVCAWLQSANISTNPTHLKCDVSKNKLGNMSFSIDRKKHVCVSASLAVF